MRLQASDDPVTTRNEFYPVPVIVYLDAVRDSKALEDSGCGESGLAGIPSHCFKESV
jgi:hypothetical protein